MVFQVLYNVNVLCEFVQITLELSDLSPESQADDQVHR
jgi:hypothetical protein